MILSIDPGTDSGWALFHRDHTLAACGLGDPRSSELHRTKDLVRVVVEQPFIYPKGKANPNDLIKLALKAGEWGGAYRTLGIEVEYVFPLVWKGNVPKSVCHDRIATVLSPAERELVKRACKPLAPSIRHNVLDAVGIGLWACDRWMR